MGRASAVVTLAARDGDPPVRVVLLRRAGDLPAAGRAGRRSRGAGRRAAAVAGLHAGLDGAAVGGDGPGGRPPRRVLLLRPVRGVGPGAAPGRVRDLRRDVGVPPCARVLAGRQRPGHQRGGRADGPGRRGPRAGQRHRLLQRPVRPRRDPPRLPRRLARRRPPRGPPHRRPAHGHRRAAHRGRADRRDQLHQRDPPDHPVEGGAAPTRRAPSWAARGPGPASSSSWPWAASSPAPSPAPAPARPG